MTSSRNSDFQKLYIYIYIIYTWHITQIMSPITRNIKQFLKRQIAIIWTLSQILKTRVGYFFARERERESSSKKKGWMSGRKERQKEREERKKERSRERERLKEIRAHFSSDLERVCEALAGLRTRLSVCLFTRQLACLPVCLSV